MLGNLHSFILILSLFLIIYLVNYTYLYYKYKEINKKELMNNIMGTVFLVFSVLKFLDLTKFVKIFSKYDLITKFIPIYGYIYPFIELTLSILFFSRKYLKYSYIVSIILMITSLLSVGISMIKGQQLRCGCLGSFLHIPLSYVTISENVIMLLMASNLMNII